MVTTALTWITDTLVAAGYRATVNPPDLNPPAIWLSAQRLGDPTLPLDMYPVVVDLYLIVPDTGIPNALRELEDLLGGVLEIIAASDHLTLESTALNETVTLPSSGGPLPTYRITVTYDP